MKSVYLGLLLAFALISVNNLASAQKPVADHNLWPIPSSYTSGSINLPILDYCNFQFNLISKNSIPQIQEIIRLYNRFLFPSCTNQRDIDEILIEEDSDIDLELPTANNNVLYINISDTSNIYMQLNTDESYTLQVSSVTMTLFAKTYLGFLRGMETFSQLFSYQIGPNNAINISIPNTPVIISDSPRYPHRGIMIDTSRHFISKENLFKLMDGMLYSKLNVLHWHITDSDSFPIESLSHPNLTKYGAFSPFQVYTAQDVQEIVQYAITRGIRIIPEIDSPSHVTSWSYAPEAANLINCSQSVWYHGIPFGQINPTLDETYNLVKDLISDLQTYFWPWEFLHFGCDEVYSWCWNNNQINQWMKQHNMSSYNDLFNYYISRQKTLKNANRTGLYWGNADTMFLKFGTDDIIQYWGSSADQQRYMANYPKNKMVLSNYDALYLDCGVGNYFGNKSWCDPFKTWLTIYQWDPQANVGSQYWNNILGAEACQWSEVNNDATVQDRIWPRAAALGERLWSPFANKYNHTLSVFTRLNAWRERVHARGIPSMPLSAGYCEKNPSQCF